MITALPLARTGTATELAAGRANVAMLPGKLI
jgi:hypothetical protein